MLIDLDFSVGGNAYTTTKFKARSATAYLAQIGQIMAMTGKGMTSEEADADLAGMKTAALILESVLKIIPPDKVPDFLEGMLSTTTVISGDGDGRKKIDLRNQQNFDLHFQGRLGELMEVVKIVFEFQFKEAFEKLASLMPTLQSEASEKKGASLKAL